ncbi:hypothetical protein CERSUDRAFT_91136 [Gelatoporia subvermispora B]|uniref:Uncharacterized protein n=1 Tax=Ceriporiopsis subvermispora (strain B) TaxID=914234 RepID=M2PUL7_CERS8|nr:hypothetical protein CERSUDRAFT_91136 [Gelatoporia subvermispora B]
MDRQPARQGGPRFPTCPNWQLSLLPARTTFANTLLASLAAQQARSFSDVSSRDYSSKLPGGPALHHARRDRTPRLPATGRTVSDARAHVPRAAGERERASQKHLPLAARAWAALSHRHTIAELPRAPISPFAITPSSLLSVLSLRLVLFRISLALWQNTRKVVERRAGASDPTLVLNRISRAVIASVQNAAPGTPPIRLLRLVPHRLPVPARLPM